MKKNIIKLTTLLLVGVSSLSSCFMSYEGSHIEPGHWATSESIVWEDGFVIDSFEIMIEEVDQNIDYTDYIPDYGEIYKEQGIYYLVSFYMNGDLLVDGGALTHIRGLLNQAYFLFDIDGIYYTLIFTGYYYNNKKGSYFHIGFGLDSYSDSERTMNRTNLSASPSGYHDLYPVE
ncbi:MAG: hypothetical protein LUD22_02530 [Coprobacillus sp.]|nr:hypothetical protein [Coprobacillus sp.]